MRASAARKNWLDGLAIGVSFTCVVHCLALPALIAFLPAWSAWLDLPEAFHLWLLAFAVPVSLAVLLQPARRRASFAPLLLGIAGLALMAVGLAIPGSRAEPIVTSLGAILLAAGHLVNWRLRSHRHG